MVVSNDLIVAVPRVRENMKTLCPLGTYVVYHYSIRLDHREHRVVCAGSLHGREWMIDSIVVKVNKNVGHFRKLQLSGKGV